MPLPNKRDNESHEDFMSRCMSNKNMRKEYPDQQQRAAVCMNKSKSTLQHADDEYYSQEYGFTEELSEANIVVPSDDEYIDLDEDTEVVDLDVALSKYKYKDPKTGEVYTYERRGVYKKNGRTLIPVKSAEYQGRKVTLNKPFRTPKGPKKFAVYTKNEKGSVVIVRFGDPNMEIKRDNPERRKSFRARHNCDNPGPKYKARYWSCRMW